VESEHIEFSELPDEDNEAHKGIMETAKYIKSDLDRLQLLEKAFQEHPVGIISLTMKLRNRRTYFKISFYCFVYSRRSELQNVGL
jgi:hypothetical protein